MTCYLDDVGASYAVGHDPGQAELELVGGATPWAVDDEDAAYVRMQPGEDVCIIKTYLRRRADVTSRAHFASMTLAYNVRAESTAGNPVVGVGVGTDTNFGVTFGAFNQAVTTSWQPRTCVATLSFFPAYYAYQAYTSVPVGEITPVYLLLQVTGGGPPFDWVRLTHLAWRVPACCPDLPGRLPIYGSVAGPVLPVPAGVQTGDALVTMVVYKGGPSGFVTHPAGLGATRYVFYDTGDDGHFAEYSEAVIFGRAYAHDGRSEYVWTDVDHPDDFTIHYCFVPDPNIARYPTTVGGDDALLITQTSATMGAEVDDGHYTADVLRWDGGYDPDTGPLEGPLFDEPSSPSVWVVKFWSSQTAGNTAAIGGVLVEDGKTAITCPASITPGYCEYQASSIPNPATGPFSTDVSVWWETTGIVIHSCNRPGLPPLRNAQRDDLRNTQRTSRQLSIRNAAYL